MLKNVPSCPGYLVDDQGKVFSLRPSTRFAKPPAEPRLMKQFFSRKNGYLSVTLQINGTKHRRPVHHLVLEAFVGPKPENHFGLHREGGKMDNSPDNLYWGTNAQNIRDRVLYHETPMGEDVQQAILKEREVRDIRASTVSHRKTAVAFGVHVSTIKDIRSRRTWKHLSDD